MTTPGLLVLLHGFTHTRASWDAVIAALEAGPATAGDRTAVIPGAAVTPGVPNVHRTARALDIRGHGSASAAQPVSLDAVIADVTAAVGPVGPVGPAGPAGPAAPAIFTLAGYSMGGRLALHVAVTHPRRVTRLILVGASPGIADVAKRAARRAADEALAAELRELSIEQFAQRWARTPVLAGQPPAVAAAVHADRLRNTAAGLAAALRGLGTGALPSLWDRLGELTMPVDLIVGERDVKFRATAERMAAALPAARLHVVPGAGHAVHLEAPTAVAEIIAAAGS